MSRVVRAADRARDAVAVACLVGGAALFVHAHLGMRRIAGGRIQLGQNELLGSYYRHFRAISWMGLGLAAAGLGIALWAHWRHSRSTPTTE